MVISNSYLTIINSFTLNLLVDYFNNHSKVINASVKFLLISQLKNEMELKDKSYQEELKRSELSLLAKVNQSTQFQELKKLLLTRNQQLKELREQLKKQ